MWWLRALQLLAPITLCATTACNLTTSVERAEEVRIQVESSSAGPVTIITSNFFTVVEEETGDVRLNFLVSDTAFVDLPHDRTYALAPTSSFAVRLEAPLEEDIRVTLRASTQGTQRFRREGILLDLERPLDFFYTTN